MHEPQTHDYTRRYWGHDYVFTPVDGGARGSMLLIGSAQFRVGDYLIMAHKNGDTTRYQIETLRRKPDPSDLYEATVRFAPRAFGEG